MDTSRDAESGVDLNADPLRGGSGNARGSRRPGGTSRSHTHKRVYSMCGGVWTCLAAVSSAAPLCT